MVKKPVFIIGINPRSGTNYLLQLITQHPDCVVSNHSGEDFLLYGADKFFEFYNKVTGRWVRKWKNDPERFRSALEYGIMHYLEPPGSNAEYIVSKTPVPDNSEMFLKMFKEAYLVLIVRKGQDVVESFVRTNQNRFFDVVRGWRNGAERICSILNNKVVLESGRMICVKYEDLYTKNREVMDRVLDLLKLDKSKYDFSANEKLGVIGSSTFKRGGGEVDWTPKEKTGEFNPLGRSGSWGRYQHYWFNFIAGKYAKQLGYELSYEQKGLLYYCYVYPAYVLDAAFRLLRRILINLKIIDKKKSRIFY